MDRNSATSSNSTGASSSRSRSSRSSSSSSSSSNSTGLCLCLADCPPCAFLCGGRCRAANSRRLGLLGLVQRCQRLWCRVQREQTAQDFAYLQQGGGGGGGGVVSGHAEVRGVGQGVIVDRVETERARVYKRARNRSVDSASGVGCGESRQPSEG